jgi:Domain of unknown function (DUF4157)
VFDYGSKRTDERTERSGSAGQPVLQRKCTQCEEEGVPLQPLQRKETTEAQPAAAAAGSAIVEDGSPLGPGQMHRSAFMAQVRALVTAMCNAQLAVVGRSSDGCPYIQRWLDYYDKQPAASLMRAIQLYAGASPNAPAPALLGALLGRVHTAVETWIASGQVTGTPDGMDALDPNASPPPEAQAPPGGQPVQAKRANASATAAEPAAVRSSLGPGRALDGSVRGHMERAFQQSFGDVRVHTDGRAAAWNDNLSARAFTVGTDVAFGSGEYRPGTLHGDLLIAHELAHVAQQRGGSVTAERAEDRGLESEADRAAAAAVGLLPHMQLGSGRGLALQRCSKKEPRPGMGLAPGLAPGEDSKEYTLDEYIKMWVPRQFVAPGPPQAVRIDRLGRHVIDKLVVAFVGLDVAISALAR